MISMKRMPVFAAALVIFTAILIPREAAGQSATTGAITGTVTDPSSAIVPQANVELTSRDTNAVLTAKTNAAGQYSFNGVRPGAYKITVKMTGFRTSSVRRVSTNRAGHAGHACRVSAVRRRSRIESGPTLNMWRRSEYQAMCAPRSTRRGSVEFKRATMPVTTTCLRSGLRSHSGCTDCRRA